MNYNILYCFDSNYNQQAFSSISSLLDKASSKISLHILHKEESKTDFFPKYIKNHKKIKKISVHQFNSSNYKFPNIENAHVSEATYYRIYFDDYLPNDIDFLMYLDSDFICVNDPCFVMKDSIYQLREKQKVIGAVTQNVKNESNRKMFENINMQSEKYFNAGMLLINVKKWNDLKLKEKMLEKLNNLDFELKFWDQDLFNHIIDGNYVELSNRLNWQVRLETSIQDYQKETNKNSPIFLHFLGKQKPWIGKGLFTQNSEIYQGEFRKHSKDFYHIEHRWMVNSLKSLLNSIFNLQFFNIKNKKKFLFLFFRNYFIKRGLV